jgi:hypothetical protein
VNKRVVVGFLATSAVAWGSAAQAAWLFDFQNGQGVQEIGSWDWNVTSFVAVGGSEAIENFAFDVGAGNTGECTTLDCTFTILSHASLSGANDTEGNSLFIEDLHNPNGGFEITMQFKFRETVTGLTGTPGGTGTQAEFAINMDDGEWLEVFYDRAVNSSALTGFGFNDGTKILSGDLITDSNGQFSISTSALPGRMDQFNTDNYTSDTTPPQTIEQSTVVGQGTQGEFSFGETLVQDNTFFRSQLEDFGITFTNLSIALPFQQTNPSDCFADATTASAVGGSSTQPQQCANVHVAGPYSAQAADPNGGYLPVTGSTNGLGPVLNPDGLGGPDFVAQTDFNSSATGVVPEPASIALVGFGLAGLGFSAVRRRRARR